MSDIITMIAIQEEIDKLTRKVDRIRTTLKEVERRRDALAITLQHFLKPSPTTKRRRVTMLEVEPAELQGKTLDEALIYIAEQNGGIVPSTAARHVLTEAGVLTGRQIGNRLWVALDRSDRFERVAKGRYRLLDDSDSNPDNFPTF